MGSKQLAMSEELKQPFLSYSGSDSKARFMQKPPADQDIYIDRIKWYVDCSPCCG